MPITTMGYQVITSRSIDKHKTELIIMISLSEKEEECLDNGFLSCKKDNQTFTITKDNIICYGSIDFHVDGMIQAILLL